MIILRNSYYSSPYYGDGVGYSDLEERLYFDTRKVATEAGKRIKAAIKQNKNLTRREKQRLRQKAYQLSRFGEGKGFTGEFKARVDSGISSERDIVRRSMDSVTATNASLDPKIEKMANLDSIVNRNAKDPLASRWVPGYGTSMVAERGYMQRLGNR